LAENLLRSVDCHISETNDMQGAQQHACTAAAETAAAAYQQQQQQHYRKRFCWTAS
jgi:hypothetical protein